VVGSVLIVRSLTLEAYGAFSYYLWLAGIASTLGTLSFPHALTKVTSELLGRQQRSDARALSGGVALGVAGLNLLLSIGLLIWAASAPAPQRTYLLIIAAFLVPGALAAVLRSTLLGHERYRPISAIGIAAALLQLALIVVVFLAGWGAPGFVVALLSTNIVQLIGLAWVLMRAARAPNAAYRPSNATVRRYFAFCAPATLPQLLAIVVWDRSEVFFLKRYSGIEQVGYYNLAYTFFAMFLALGWALVNGYYPAISRDYGAGAWDRIRAQVRQGVLLTALYAVPLSFGGWSTAEGLIAVLYGRQMLSAVPVAQVLFAGLLSGVAAAMLSLTVSALGGIWLHVRLGLALSIVNLGLAFALAPRLGALGGAIANTGSQLLFAALLFVAARRLYKVAFPWRLVGEIMGVGALTTLLVPRIVLAWLPGAWGLVSAIVLAACLYALAIWRLGYLHLLQAPEAA
jgi:O-antigen/teichoic acid export membrane protein